MDLLTIYDDNIRTNAIEIINLYHIIGKQKSSYNRPKSWNLAGAALYTAFQKGLFENLVSLQDIKNSMENLGYTSNGVSQILQKINLNGLDEARYEFGNEID